MKRRVHSKRANERLKTTIGADGRLIAETLLGNNDRLTATLGLSTKRAFNLVADIRLRNNQ